jgi:hypothetical protein
MAFIKLRKVGVLENDWLIDLIIEKLVKLRSPINLINPRNPKNYFCWGYSFPWQTRTIIVPRNAPNLVCTYFVANALVEAYEWRRDEHCLEMAISAGEYILNELYWTDGGNVASFSYPLPFLQTRVHNANFLGSHILSRIYKNTGEKKFLEPSLKVTRYSASMQYENGAWDYGEHSTQQWVDNFHTGYNLCALQSISEIAGTLEFKNNIRRGFVFYRDNFFTDFGAPKYFHNRIYPIDIHSVAQSIITLSKFSNVDEKRADLTRSVLDWAINNMWDEQGYFYYQVQPFYKNRISYMRWSQAWMLLALTTFLEFLDKN